MNNLGLISKQIKEKRLSLNLSVSDVAKQAGITRATLSAIENNNSNVSYRTLFKVLDILGIEFSINTKAKAGDRKRASRKNNIDEKKINRFIVMCVEQYASNTNENSRNIYKEMKEKGVLNELHDDYEDLHGMSQESLNQYIGALVQR